MKSIMIRRSFTFALVVSVVAFPLKVVAQESITLRIADWMPESHSVSSHGGKVFMEKATELSDGRIQFQYFPAEQIGKAADSLQMAQTGVADIVNLAPAYMTDKFPLASVAELPGIYEGSCVASYALADMGRPGEMLYESEFKRRGVRSLFTAAIGVYRVMTTDTEIQSPDDFKGLKLRTAGGPMAQTANLIGAVPIRMTGSEVLTSLQRGTLDGVFFPVLSVKPYSLMDVINNWVPNLGVGSFVTYYSISEETWSGIPSDLQNILIEAGDYATKVHCEYVESEESKEANAFEMAGIKATPLSEADSNRITESFGSIQQAWAKGLDERGLPGTSVLQDFRERVAD